MPEDGSKLIDVAAFADAAVGVDLSVGLADLERLKSLLVRPQGRAQARIEFSREGGHAIADVQARAVLILRCQRCLREFDLPVAGHSRVALVTDESSGASLPDELETVLAVDGRLRLRDLVEEELLLAVPAAPRHPAQQCEVKVEAGDAAHPAAPDESGEGSQQGVTQRPFAGLADMLGGRSLKK